VSCVFFAHGVGGTAWYGAKEDTGWLNLAAKEDLIVVFIQSKGLFFDEKRKNSSGKEVWAASSWDYVYSSGDLLYTDAVYDAVVKQLFPGVIDTGKVFFCGYDSGGMFAWSVACSLKFSAVFAYNGGIDEHYLCDRKSMMHPISSSNSISTDPKRCPVWICCGESYAHKNRTLNAFRVYKELEWGVKMTETEGGAEWPVGIEEEVFAWFQIARDDELIKHVKKHGGA
jgi:predicted esterase